MFFFCSLHYTIVIFLKFATYKAHTSYLINKHYVPAGIRLRKPTCVPFFFYRRALSNRAVDPTIAAALAAINHNITI